MSDNSICMQCQTLLTETGFCFTCQQYPNEQNVLAMDDVVPVHTIQVDVKFSGVKICPLKFEECI